MFSVKIFMSEIQKQNDSHDWFGDCAESYVAYLFAKAGFEVFGAGKWTADLAVHDRNNKWLRIEVRSADRNKKPAKKPARKLKDRAEFLAEVRLIEFGRVQFEISRLRDGESLKETREKINSERELKTYIEKNRSD